MTEQTVRQIRDYVAHRLSWLQAQGEHPQKAVLSKLRRGVGHAPGDQPELWGSFLQDFPPELESQDGIPTRAEWATYLALTFYALHQQGIEAEGFSCDSEFKAAVARRVPDAVLLDIMLPDTDGLEILRRLRADQETATVPIMMLTAKDTELDKVVALDGGADDYLTKPFSLMELTSRCRALLRRGGMTKKTSDVLSAGGIVLSPSHRRVTVDGEEVKLTLREFDLLEFLMRKPGVVFSREALLQSVWGWDFDGGSRTVDVHVQTLRQKLGEHSSCIETVRGVGYRFADSAV